MDAFQHISTHTFWDLGRKDWLKVQLCFFTLKEALEPYVEEESEVLHMDLTYLCQNCDLCEIDDSNGNLTNICQHCEEKWKIQIEQFASMGYKIDWQSKDVFMRPIGHWSVAKCFIPYDQENKYSASTSDISAILSFIVNCTKFTEEKFGDIQINAKKVLDDRKRDIHQGVPKVSYETLQDYKNNMVNLLKNGKLKAAGRADDAVTFIEKVCGDDYIISLEDELKAQFSALEGKMELTHHILVSKYNQVANELYLLNSKIRELDEEKVDLNNLSEMCEKLIQHFKEVSSVDYHLSAEELLTAKFSALEAHMELILSKLSELDSPCQSIENEIQLLRRKLGELGKQKEETSDLNELKDLHMKVMQNIEIANGIEVDRQHIEDKLNQAQRRIDEINGQLEEVKAQKANNQQVLVHSGVQN